MAQITRDRVTDKTGMTETVKTTFDVWGELVFVLAVLLLALWLLSAHRTPTVQVHISEGAATDAEAPALPTDARTYAALQVFGQATDDDWLQRAAIAQASLNAFRAGVAAAPAFRGGVARAGALDPIAWQNALDAVDAVATGDYPLPLACSRASSVVPSTATAGSGSQCIVGGLAFVERPL